MKIFYPYNEILPTHKAHDVFIFNECLALAKQGLDISLLCGKGTLELEKLCRHYNLEPHPNFHLCPTPIIRKNNRLNLSWGRYFRFHCQRAIRKQRPDCLLLSVRKQALYHLMRKVKGVRYVYEVHQLESYPTAPRDSTRERAILERVDLITVTTEALKSILRAPPYALSVPIEVVPLAVNVAPLPPPPEQQKPFNLYYIGQLYEGQGMTQLLRALTEVKNVHLTIIGGEKSEIERYKILAHNLDLTNCVDFLGFRPPGELPSLISEAHGFVAPFEPVGRMPYVAHTKLYEYARWGRPFIAPKLPSVEEHFNESDGALLFKPGDVTSLTHAIERIKKGTVSLSPKETFTWPTRAAHYQKLLHSIK